MSEANVTPASSGHAKSGASPDPGPIFIVGNGRAGTTLLRLMLSAHPRIYICHETTFYLWERVFPKRRNGEELAKYYFLTYSFRYLHLSPEEVLAEVDRPLSRERSGELFRAVMKRKAAQYGRPRYGDKTPAHTSALARLFRDFPNAKVLHIVRDPRATLLSLSRMPWASACDLANGFLYESERKLVAPYSHALLRVRLEDLLARPRAEMERILDFVGEPWDESVLRHSEHLPGDYDMPAMPWLLSATRPRAGATQRWEEMSPLRIRVIERICRPSLAAWGYSRAVVDREPSRIRVWLEIIRQIPEAIRFAWTYFRFWRRSRDPRTLNDPTCRDLFHRINPHSWDLYPGFEIPEPPPLPPSRAS